MLRAKSSIRELADACKVPFIDGELRPGDVLEELPNGEVVWYADTTHRYWWLTPEGREPLHSVTTVLKIIDKPALVRWAWNLGKQGIDFEATRKEAATRGTSIHQAADVLASTGVPPKLSDFPESDRGYVQALAAWWLETRPQVIATEVIVASLIHRFAGRFDLLCVIDGKRTLVDFKTSRGVHPVEMFAQLEAYEGASVESGHPPTDRRVIVRLDESGEPEEAESCASFNDFLGFKAAFDAQKRIDKGHKAVLKAAA